MNRFFRTAYAATFVYLCLALFGVLITGVQMPFLSFSCLYFGLLIFLLPGAQQRLSGKEQLFYGLGIMTALLGFLPIALFHCPAGHYLTHLLGIAATAVFLSILRHRTTHSVFLAKYEFTVVLLLILAGFVCLAMLTDIYQAGGASARSEVMGQALNNIIPYAVILLASGILLLRGLRAQEGMVDDQAFNRRQLRDVLIFAVLVTLLFAADPFVYLKKAVLFLFYDVLRPSALFLLRLLASLLKAMSRREQPGEVIPSTEEALSPEPIPTVEPSETEPEHYFFEGNDLALTIAYIFIAAAALILIYILALQIRKLIKNLHKRSRSGGNGYPNEVHERLVLKEGTGREKKPKRKSSDPREQIRYLYSEFLLHLNKLWVRVGRTETCNEIRHHAENRLTIDPSTLSGLTELYEKARYRLEETPTEADAHAMKDLLDEIKKSK